MDMPSGRITSREAISDWHTVRHYATTLVIVALLFGCSSGAEHSDSRAAHVAGSGFSAEQCLAGGKIQQAATMSRSDTAYVIQPGDQLTIDFYLNPEFNDEVTVRPDGRITLKVVGDVPAAGHTPTQLADALDKAYLTELRSPDAAVHVRNMPSRLVYVQGQVSKPGSFALEPGMTALQAISEAGGLADTASDTAILIRRDACGQAYGTKVDLASAQDDPAKDEDLALMPHDILVVPRSTIANVDLFVKQYITGVLPIPPYVSFPGPAL